MKAAMVVGGLIGSVAWIPAFLLYDRTLNPKALVTGYISAACGAAMLVGASVA